MMKFDQRLEPACEHISRSDSTEPSTRAQAEGLAEVLLRGALQRQRSTRSCKENLSQK